MLEAFATQAEVAIENARLYQEAIERHWLQAEMEEAAKIQENLLPEASPAISGYEVAGLSIPRRDGVDGDYYDYIREPDESWGLVIADVVGIRYASSTADGNTSGGFALRGGKTKRSVDHGDGSQFTALRKQSGR